MKKSLVLAVFLSCSFLSSKSQESSRYLSLGDCIEKATESTLMAFQTKYMYLVSYWEYRTYKAERLPSLSLQLTPVQYSSYFVKRYDYNENIEVYRKQQIYNASGGLSVTQNLDWTGGTFILDSGLDFMRNFGDNTFNQYSSIPLRLGYSQSLFGFNRFKWEKKIEPVKFENAKQQYLFSIEEIAEAAVDYFFNLASAQSELEMAMESVQSSDTLYRAGKERRRISSISEAEFLTLEVDLLNARNAVENAKLRNEKALSALHSFLNIQERVAVELILPETPDNVEVLPEIAIAQMHENNPNLLSHRQKRLESERDLEQMRRLAGMDANLSVSIGFNQVGENLRKAYSDPLRQDLVRVGLSVPLVDWGIRKGKVNIAKTNLDLTNLALEQQQINLEEELKIIVAEFNKQRELMLNTRKALEMAIVSHQLNQQRFIMGMTDVNTVILSLNRRKDSQRNYLSILHNYWRSYYSIRKMTLYDFAQKEKLAFPFENFLN